MSAYRTPYYNHAIGDVKYSMHQWGSAADVYVDPDKKNRMEDLNRDGRVDIQDAKFLYDEIERMLTTKESRRFAGRNGLLSRHLRTSAVRPRRRPRHRGPLERMRSLSRDPVFVVAPACCAAPRQARAYSVLSHEANVDALWDTGIRPLLARRFPGRRRGSPEGSRLRVRRVGDSGPRLLSVRQPFLQQPAALRQDRRLRRGDDP